MPDHSVPSELDKIVDAVLSYNPETKEIRDDSTKPNVKTWATSISDIFRNEGVRLDATHYDPAVVLARRKLTESGYKLETLGKLASIVLPGQFTRIWADDNRHGVKYLNATDLLSLMALGVPAGGQRFLSRATDTNIDALIIKEGWLLMSCSGTIGRVFYVPSRLDGWAATHDIIRIIPHNKGITGFLYSWLTTTNAQAQILSHTHGGQIDHITDDQVAGVIVPMLPDDRVQHLHNETMKALRARERALETLSDVWHEAERAIE